ncbi:hypothetical protein EJ06DRAFT_526471 [Trichodelitschia bisporula]|uniref:Uncharacterized protein n=1 Tax=Trichodelitschia bisporula TaxID=703511 RepID=A0A6G1I875_9PEZI|nr:hypothetical protein EJ06DRAFT_526471 [Trichodelitschia bisporula]
MLEIFDSVKAFLMDKGQQVMNIVPPEKRAELMAEGQKFVINNPKLAFFLLSHISLSAVPIVLFILFSISVFLVALVVSLVIALLATVLFTAFMVGVALLVLFPTVLAVSTAATFLFLWGVGGYYLLKHFNLGESPAAQGEAIGDKLNELAGGRLDFIMKSARASAAGSVGSDAAADEKEKLMKEEEDDHASNKATKAATGAPKKLGAQKSKPASS